MRTERLIYDTGRAPLFVRLLITPFGFAGACLSPLGWRESVLRSLFCSFFGLFMLSIWFWRTRLFYDSDHREIVFRGSTTLWIPRRLSLTGAAAVYLHDVRMLTSDVTGTNIGIRYQDGRESWLTRVEPGDPQRIATLFSEATNLPIAK